eukprot:UN26706
MRSVKIEGDGLRKIFQFLKIYDDYFRSCCFIRSLFLPKLSLEPRQFTIHPLANEVKQPPTEYIEMNILTNQQKIFYLWPLEHIPHRRKVDSSRNPKSIYIELNGRKYLTS